MCFDCGLTYFLDDWMNLYDLKFLLLKILHFVYSSIFGNDISMKVSEFLPNFLVTSAFVHSRVNYYILEYREYADFEIKSIITKFDNETKINSLIECRLFLPGRSLAHEIVPSSSL